MQASKLMAAAVVSLFVVVACGGSGGTSPSAPTATTGAGAATSAPTRGTADPCTLLTQADIKTATGSAYGPGVADAYGHCRWFLGPETAYDAVVTVAFAPPGTTLASLKAKSFGGTDLTVSGHPAYWDTAAMGPTLFVDLGTSVLGVGIDPLPVGGQAMAQHMAELAVAKL